MLEAFYPKAKDATEAYFARGHVCPFATCMWKQFSLVHEA